MPSLGSRKQELERIKTKRVLVVCEGEEKCSEHLYLWLYKQIFKLENFDIKIVPCGKKSDFHHITQKALECINKSEHNPYTHVFCVADADNEKEKYKKVGEKIDGLKRQCAKQKVRVEVRAIISNPCFEFWILLHFCYTTAFFKNDKDLKGEIDCQLNKSKKSEKYQKCDQKLYKIIVKRHEMALENAEQVQQVQEQNNESKNYPNPCTQFNDLIRFLTPLRKIP